MMNHTGTVRFELLRLVVNLLRARIAMKVNTKKIIPLFFLTMLLVHGAVAQQAPLFSQYMLNKYAINPAFGGLEQSMSVTAVLRAQWNQLPGSPSTQAINAHLPLYFLQGSAGFDLTNDQIGATAVTRFTASYNYVMDSPYGLFSLGLRGGVRQVRLRSAELRTPSGIYQDLSVDHRDPLLTSGSLDGYSPTWAIGLYFAGGGIELGATYENPGNRAVAGNTALVTSSSITVFGSYDIGVNDYLVVIPSLLIRTDGIQTQGEMTVLGRYGNYIGGLGLRGYNANSLDAIQVIAGAQVSKHIRVAYSFDLGISALRNQHDGTHEFTVNYNLAQKIRTGELPRIIYNPRFH